MQLSDICTQRSIMEHLSTHGVKNAGWSQVQQSVRVTPVAVVRLIRDILVMENGDGLNLALGTSRDWLGSGEPVGIAGACTQHGKVSYQMQYDSTGSKVMGEINFDDHSSAVWAVIHIRLPEGLKVKSVDPESKAVALPAGIGLRWETPRGTIKFCATIGQNRHSILFLAASGKRDNHTIKTTQTFKQL
jgi:hypothetical protein